MLPFILAFYFKLTLLKLSFTPKVNKKFQEVGDQFFRQHRVPLPCPIQHLRHFISFIGTISHKLPGPNHLHKCLHPRQKLISLCPFWTIWSSSFLRQTLQEHENLTALPFHAKRASYSQLPQYSLSFFILLFISQKILI